MSRKPIEGGDEVPQRADPVVEEHERTVAPPDPGQRRQRAAAGGSARGGRRRRGAARRPRAACVRAGSTAVRAVRPSTDRIDEHEAVTTRVDDAAALGEDQDVAGHDAARPAPGRSRTGPGPGPGLELAQRIGQVAEADQADGHREQQVQRHGEQPAATPPADQAGPAACRDGGHRSPTSAAGAGAAKVRGRGGAAAVTAAPAAGGSRPAAGGGRPDGRGGAGAGRLDPGVRAARACRRRRRGW